MKHIGTSIALLLATLSTIAIGSESSTQQASATREGPYVGQKPPGLAPELFTPGILSSEYRDWGGNFTPDMKEYYVSRRNHETGKSSIILIKSENNQWRESVIWPSGRGGSISPDGKTMHIGRQYRERKGETWSELKSLGPLFEEFRIMRLTASLEGTYVFDEVGTNGNGILRYSRLVDGKRQAPQPFGKTINTGKWTAHPFIAPDESYVIWDSERTEGYGDSDMYISFRQTDGSWGPAINFGETINTDSEDGGGYVTPDGKYLIYCRRCTPPNFEIMWVDAKIIETLKP